MEKLKEIYNRIINLDSFKDGSYSGQEFLLALEDFIDAWNNFIYNSKFSSESEKKGTLLYQIRLWFELWKDEVLKETSISIRGNTDFIYPIVLSSVIGSTGKFLEADNDVDRSESFKYSWTFLEGIPYRSLWATEESLGIQSYLLPNYFIFNIHVVSRQSRLFNWVNRDKMEYKSKEERKEFSKIRRIVGQFYDDELKKNKIRNYLSNENCAIYSQSKERLKKSLEDVLSCSSYIDKTYEGMELFNLLKAFGVSWTRVIYGCLSIYDDIENRRGKWLEWLHSFNFECYKSFLKGIPFREPLFLEKILSQTKDFCDAETIEEENEILKTRYFLERGPGSAISSEFVVHKWVSAVYDIGLPDENIGNFSLSDYYPADVSNYLRGPELYLVMDEAFNNPKSECYFESSYASKLMVKYFWKAVNLAVSKGIIIDNYEEKIKSGEGYMKAIFIMKNESSINIPLGEEFNKIRERALSLGYSEKYLEDTYK